MSQSPARVTFSYAHPTTPQRYSPRLIQSGFLIGEPIAFTDHPQLPPQYQSFSPKPSRLRTASLLEYRAVEPAHFAPPQRQSLPFEGQTVPMHEYQQLLSEHRQLQERYARLQSAGGFGGEERVLLLIEKYKANVLQECALLMERARLEHKELQLDSQR